MPDRPSSTDVARVRERLEDAACHPWGPILGWQEVRETLREAASLLADYEARGEALARADELADVADRWEVTNREGQEAIDAALRAYRSARANGEGEKA